MLYNPPTGGAANDSYVGKNVAAAQQGSKIPPKAVEAPQREIMAVIAADPNLTPTNDDLTQLLQAIKYLIPKYAPAGTGAAANGGLAKDGSNNLLLAFLNLLADNRAAPAGNDLLALERMADGSTVSITTAALGAYISSLFQQNATFTQITPTNLVGLSLAPIGDFAIPRGVMTTVPLQPITVNNAFGTVSGGVLTLNRSGYYVVATSGALSMISNNHAVDAANLVFSIGAPGIESKSVLIPPNGGQASANYLFSFVTRYNAGDKIALTAMADNLFHDGNSCAVSGYTNMLVALLNA